MIQPHTNFSVVSPVRSKVISLTCRGLFAIMLVFFTGCGSVDSSEKQTDTNKAGSSENTVASGTKVIPVKRVVKKFNWPFWRGPQKDGMSQETDWNTDWKTPPESIWINQIGIGYSAVSIDKGRLFTMGHPAGTETETMWCFDAVTGKEIWSKSYPCILLDHLHKGGPCATPTIDGEFVYFNSREGEVRKVKAKDGDIIWTISLQKELDIELPEWGFSCSAILNGDEIIFEAGSVIGVDKQTGKIKWKTRPRMPGYGTPELFTFNNKPYLCDLTNEGISVIDMTSHKEVAFTPWDSPYKTNSTTPIWHNGQLFISTGYNIGCTLLNFDGKELTEVYKNKNMRNHMNSCVLHEGYLYGVDGNSHNPRTVTINCIDWKTGQIAWEQRDLGCGALTATKDHLIVLSDTGDLVLAKLTPDAFHELGRVRVMHEQCWTVPTLCNGLIYCRGADGTLACVDVRLKP